MPLTEVMPKCCLHLEGISLLEWQIQELSQCGIDEVVVVTGFGHEAVEEVVSRSHSIPVRTLYNPFYAMSDNLGTCWVVRSEMNQPFVLINGDTLFEAEIMKRLLAGAGEFPITLATDKKGSYDADDMKIHSEGDRLDRVGKRLELNRVNGESIGMMVFNARGAASFVHKVETLMGQTDGLNRWYLSAIDELAQSGQVGINCIHGLSWCEVDDLADLAFAETVVRSWQEDTNRRRPASRRFGFQPVT
jgi:choline kinase